MEKSEVRKKVLEEIIILADLAHDLYLLDDDKYNYFVWLWI